MFRREGIARTDRLNRVLAGYLALVGGYVNATGIVLLGVFCSHMTGNVSRMATDLTSGKLLASLSALAGVSTFFFGSLLASMILESASHGRTARAYGIALGLEAWWLGLFTVLQRLASQRGFVTEQALPLCIAMGMQNSLVTRLSGAVVRTTHLTGVITDLGIESARWLRWWGQRASQARGTKLALASGAAERPSAAKLALLGTIAGSFSLGAIVGGTAALTNPRTVMIVPILAVVAAAVYAFASSSAGAAAGGLSGHEKLTTAFDGPNGPTSGDPDRLHLLDPHGPCRLEPAANRELSRRG